MTEIVWLLWNNEDLVGVYKDESDARNTAALYPRSGIGIEAWPVETADPPTEFHYRVSISHLGICRATRSEPFPGEYISVCSFDGSRRGRVWAESEAEAIQKVRDYDPTTE